MIFQHTHQKITNGRKTETRRLKKPGDTLANGEVRDKNGRLRWRVGGTYSVQPGRGQKGIAHIKMTAIREEPLLQLDAQAAQAEGFPDAAHFHDTWQHIHTKPRTRWQDNPMVFVLKFELVEAELQRRPQQTPTVQLS